MSAGCDHPRDHCPHPNQQIRNQAQDRKVDAAHHGDLGEDRIHVVGGITARPDARDEAAVLAHVVGRFIGIENDRNVEETEEDDSRHE